MAPRLLFRANTNYATRYCLTMVSSLANMPAIATSHHSYPSATAIYELICGFFFVCFCLHALCSFGGWVQIIGNQEGVGHKQRNVEEKAFAQISSSLHHPLHACLHPPAPEFTAMTEMPFSNLLRRGLLGSVTVVRRRWPRLEPGPAQLAAVRR